ncbi:HDOD domain-containing protein [Comamonas terrigena]|uniref:HDOD domain-containing protein n=1 Tax=Comamonas terrigena TaxID=32013 RepID=UPI00244A1134|nr:HDOD domain-containing protein [Comamonas terrigena]MDH1700673.1 HDOD domain-containing protein [Comamonas terrigena]
MQTTEDLALPCQPRVVALLLSELLSDLPNLRRVNQLFGCDPVLAARLLALANTPEHQMAGMVRGIPQALALLGVSQLRMLVNGAQKGMAVRVVQGMALEPFWRYSLMTAKLARSLAGMAHMDGSAAYAAGLLHGMGQLMLHHTQSVATAPLDEAMDIWDPRRARMEERHWGHCATHTTAALLKQWRLPRELVDSLQCMENPLAFDQFEPMAGVLHLAVWRIRTQAAQWDERSTALSFPSEVGVAMGLDMDVVMQQDTSRWMHSGF